MIEIDGSHGEGGGQILRTSVSMAAVLQEPVRVKNIRAGRPRPGLAPQHLSSIASVAELCDGEVDGLSIGSREIEFRPGTLTGGGHDFDIGTAGSVALVLQSCLLPAALSKAPVTLTITGGTDVRWAPPIDFVRCVYVPLARRFGISCDVELNARGFYPEGGGEVRMTVDTAGALTGLNIETRGEVRRVSGVAFSQNLPDHVTTRVKHAALKSLIDFREIKIATDVRDGRSTGAGIVLVAECENTWLGESALGQKGVRAEALGEGCAADLRETIHSGATVDSHALDQILTFMAIARNDSCVLAEELTGHAETNIWVIEKFLGKRFQTANKNGLVEIKTT